MASPHLLLASRLERMNPAGGVVGAYLMRHACAGWATDRFHCFYSHSLLFAVIVAAALWPFTS